MLGLLSAVAILLPAFTGSDNPLISLGIAAFMAGMFGLMTLAGVGAYRRTEASKVMFIIICVLSLINIPLGTIIGLIGLVAATSHGILFGDNRVPHKELAIAYKQSRQK